MISETGQNEREPRGRIVGIDVARGAALFAMMATHIFPLVDGDEPTGALVFAGRASALFAVLAGISIALSCRSWAIHDGRRHGAEALGLVVRGLLIIAVGLTLGLFDSGLAVILVQYGVMFLLATAFLRLPTWALGTFAALWMLLSPVASMLIRVAPLPTIDGTNPSWLELASPVGLLTDVVIDGYYPVLTWFGYILLGMAIGRLNLRNVRSAAMLVIGGVLAAAAALLASSLLLAGGGYEAIVGDMPPEYAEPLVYGSVAYTLRISGYGVAPTDTWWWLASAGPHNGTPPDLVSTAGIALAVIGLCLLLIAAAPWMKYVLSPLWLPGSMPLTIYSIHVILYTVTGADPSWPIFALHAVILIGFAALWRALVSKRGPLEFLLGLAAGGVRRSALRENTSSARLVG